MKNILLKLIILAYVAHAPLAYSMECFSLESAQYTQLIRPKNIVLGLGVVGISYFGYQFLKRSWQKTAENKQVIKLNKADSQEAQDFINRIKQELTKNNKDFRFIYDYPFIWNQIALPVYMTLENQKNNFKFAMRGIVKNDTGEVILALRGNIAGLEIKIISADYCIVMDIQDAKNRNFGSEYYKRLAERYVAHYSENLLLDFNQFIKQIKQEQDKPEHERNYQFVAQKLSQLSDFDRSLFMYSLIDNDGATLQSVQNLGTPDFDYLLGAAIVS